MRGVWGGLILLAAGVPGAFSARAEELAAGEAVVTDASGQEYRLKGVKFTSGTKRLAWLRDPKASTEDARRGPLALEFREPNSTTLVKGVVTLIPVSSIEAVQYDHEKKMATITVKGLSQPLNGTLEYKGVNSLGLNGASDGKMMSFTGGAAGKNAVKAINFGGAQPISRSKGGTTWKIQIVQPKADNPTLTARNLKALYRFPGGEERLLDRISTRKGEAVVFNESLKRFEMIANDLNTNYAVAEVEPAAGPERLVAIPLTLEQDKKAGTLIGILGEVDAGWKLFPLHTIKVITPLKRKIE